MKIKFKKLYLSELCSARPCLQALIISLICCLFVFPATAKAFSPLDKQGYLGSPILETTPLVWNGELYLLENWRVDYSAWPDDPGGQAAENNEMWMAKLTNGPSDYANRQYVSRPFEQHGLGTALIHDDRVYVFAVNELSGRHQVDVTWSDDMVNWSAPQTVLESPGLQVSQGSIFNVAVTPDADGFTFLWETEGYGTPFTMRYGHVQNLTDNWNAGIISNATYGADKYTGGPGLYYEGGWYYTTYLEHLGSGQFETRVTRSQDLTNWQDSTRGPLVTFDPSHVGLPMNPAGVETNASDAELTYYDGQTVVFYSGGDQLTSGDLQWATADLTPAQLFEYFYATGGDADLDSDVDANDLATWGANYTGDGGNGMAWSNGDFDEDGDVDADDLASWGANYTGIGGGGSMTEVVPEPMTMTLLALGGVALAHRRRKNKVKL